jgi:hypothetical protein
MIPIVGNWDNHELGKIQLHKCQKAGVLEQEFPNGLAIDAFINKLYFISEMKGNVWLQHGRSAECPTADNQFVEYSKQISGNIQFGILGPYSLKKIKVFCEQYGITEKLSDVLNSVSRFQTTDNNHARFFSARRGVSTLEKIDHIIALCQQ